MSVYSKIKYLVKSTLFYLAVVFVLIGWVFGLAGFHFTDNITQPKYAAAATENKYADNHLTGSFTNPTNAYGATNGTWAGVVNENNSQTSRWSMENPSGSITGTQTIQVYAKKGSNSNNPSISVNLYENGSLVQNVISTTNITSTTGQTLSGTFDASVITNANNVEIEVVMTASGGSPSARNAAQIDSITWVVDLANPTTTLGAGTDPASATVAPSASITDAGAFTFAVNTSTDSITALTVSLAASGTPYDGVSEVRITSDNGSTTYFSAISNPTSNTLNFSSGTPIPVTTSSTQFKIRITPKTHANMPVPGGASYALQPRVTAFTSTNGQAGSDTNANTLTIDNLSPAEVTGASATPGDAFVSLGWTNPADADFTEIIILQKAGSSISDVPVEGTNYSGGNTIGSSTVCYIGDTSPENCIGLTNGTEYFFKLFAKDSRGNYSPAGVEVSATPVGAGSSVVISGFLFSDEGVTAISASRSVNLIVDGVHTDTAISSLGYYEFSSVNLPSADSIVTVFINAATEKGSVTTRVANTEDDILDLDIYQDRVIVRSEGVAEIINSDLGLYDSTDDADLQFDVITGNLTVADGNKVIIRAGDAFTPGGNVTAPALDINGTLNLGVHTLDITGSGTSPNEPLKISGTFNASTGTVNYNGTSATDVAAATYYNLGFGTTSDVNSGVIYTLLGNITVNSTLNIGNASSTNADTLVQGPYNITTAGSGTVITVTAQAVWSNTSTGDIVLSGDVSNSGTIVMNSNNGAQCVDGTDDIVITSSVGATQRTWSGAGTFTIYNVNVTDQAGTVTVYTSTLSNSTWTNGSCGITISGTVYSDEGSTTMVGTQTVRIKVNGAGDYSGTLSSGAYSVNNVIIGAAGDVITVFLDGATEKAVTVTRAADNSSNITGLNLYQNTVIARHEDAGPITNTNLAQYDSADDADIQFTTAVGAGAYTLTVADGNKLIVWTGDTFTPGDAVTAPKVLVDGALTMSANYLTLSGTGTGSNKPLNINGTLSGYTVVYTGDGDTDVYNNCCAIRLTPTLTANRTYYWSGSSYANVFIQPNAVSTYELRVEMTESHGNSGNIQITRSGSATSYLDTTSNNYSLYASSILIEAGATLKANGSSITVTSSGSPFVVNGTYILDTSSFLYFNLTSSQNVAGTTYYDLTSSKISQTNTLAGNVIVNNNLTITGGTFNLSTYNITVNGATSITGTLDDSSTTGTNIFVGAISINSGGSMFPARNSNATIRGGITNNGTFSVGTGTWTFNTTASQTIGGTNTLTFGGIISVASGIVLTNSGTLTMTGTGTGRLAGAGTFVNGAGATLNYAGSTITVTTFIAGVVYDQNIVNYNSTTTAQTVRATTYEHLVITKSAQTATLSGITHAYESVQIVSGVLELSTHEFATISGAALTISGTLNDSSATGNNVLTGVITINSGGSWTSTGSAPYIIRNNIVNNGTFNGGAGTYTFDTAANIAISGSNTLTFGGSVSVSSGITLTNNGTMSMTGTGVRLLTGSGTFVNGENATFYYASGSVFISYFTASATGNTVVYTGTVVEQTVKGETYYNLTIDKSGQTASLGGNTTVTNDLTITAGTLTSNISGTLTIHGDFINNGTFTHNDSTVVIAGSGTSQITGSSNTTFNNFTSTAAGKTIQFKAANTYTFAGTFTITGAEGNLINITSNTGAAQWIAHFNNPQSTVTYVNISWSGCNTGTTDVALDATNTDGGNNGVCWVFATGVTVSGIVYSDEGSTTMVGTQTVRVKVNGAGDYAGTLSDGAYSIGNITINAGGDVVTVFLDGASEKAATIVIATDTESNITNTHLYQNFVTLRHPANGTITNANLAGYGSGDDADLQFAVADSVLTLADSANLRVDGGTTFNPGADVNITNGGAVGPGVISMASGTFTVDGTGNFGSSADWSFNNLTFGNSTGADLTTVTGAGEIQVDGVLTITADHTLSGGSAVFDLTASNTPFVSTGTFDPDTSTIRYSGTSATINIAAINYYDLLLGPATLDEPTYVFGTGTSQTASVANDLHLETGTIDLNTNDLELTVYNIINDGTVLASGSVDLIITGDFTNNGTFTHNSGAVVIDPINMSAVTGSSATTFYDFSSSAAGKTIEFKQSQEVTIEGNLNLSGNASNPIYLSSTQAGAQWLLNLLGDSNVNNVGVSDGGCAEGTLSISRRLRIINLGNNGSCWVFFVFSSSAGPTGGGPGGSGAVGGGNAHGGGSGTESESGGEGAEGGGTEAGPVGEASP